MYYRYELSFDGIPEEIGILVGASEELRHSAVDQDELDKVMKVFVDDLIEPDFYKIKENRNKNVLAFFTEEGVKHFKQSLKFLKYSFEKFTGFEIDEKVVKEGLYEEVYKDEYQVLLNMNS